MALTKAKKDRLTVTTMEDVGAFFGVNPSSVTKWIEAGMPRHRKGGPQSQTASYIYCLWEIAPWLRKKGPWRNQLGGGHPRVIDSEGYDLTEEIKKVKLAKEKLDLAVKRGKLIDVLEMRDRLLAWAQRRRREIETARIQFGEDVATFLNEGLENEGKMIDNDFPER